MQLRVFCSKHPMACEVQQAYLRRRAISIGKVVFSVLPVFSPISRSVRARLQVCTSAEVTICAALVNIQKHTYKLNANFASDSCLMLDYVRVINFCIIIIIITIIIHKHTYRQHFDQLTRIAQKQLSLKQLSRPTRFPRGFSQHGPGLGWVLLSSKPVKISCIDRLQ